MKFLKLWLFFLFITLFITGFNFLVCNHACANDDKYDNSDGCFIGIVYGN